MRYLLPGAYLALAAYAWFDFAATNPDGLANVGLMLVVLPITILGLLVGWLVGQEAFLLLPDRFGYLGNHAAFYVPSVLLLAAGLWLLGRWIDRRRG
jgi:hypothetical protein